MDVYGEVHPASKRVVLMPRKISERKGIDTRWFQHQLEDKGLSQRKLAKRLRMDPSAVSLMLRGKRHMRVQEAAQIADVLGVSLLEVMARAGIPSAEAKSAASGMVQVVGHITSDATVVRAAEERVPLVPAPPDAPAGTVALRYQTTLTALDILDGWVVYFRQEDAVAPDAIGRFCVVREQGTGRERVGFVRRGYAPGEYTLLAHTGAEPEAVRLECASPVIWIRP